MSVRKHHELKPCVSKFSFCSYFNKLQFIHSLTSFNKTFKGLINVVFRGKSYKAIVLNIVAGRNIISKHNGLRDLRCLIIFAGQESMPGVTECFFSILSQRWIQLLIYLFSNASALGKTPLQAYPLGTVRCQFFLALPLDRDFPRASDSMESKTAEECSKCKTFLLKKKIIYFNHGFLPPAFP